MVGFKRSLGRQKLKIMLKSFKKATNHWRKKARDKKIDEVRMQMMDQCLSGVDKASDVFSSPESYDEDVSELINRLDIEKVEHDETRRFMERIASVQQENELLDLIDDFEEFYEEKLRRRMN